MLAKVQHDMYKKLTVFINSKKKKKSINNINTQQQEKGYKNYAIHTLEHDAINTKK